ncbi:MAG: ribokinase [Puniceicoccales bacterium]
MKPLVLVIGSYNQDLYWQTPDFPQPGQTCVGRFSTLPGGKGSNQAVACARLGVPTAFCGAVGEDTFGRALPAFYRSEGIEEHLVFKRDQPTGNAAIWVNSEGENEIVISAGANGLLDPADIPQSVLCQARLLVCQNESCPATMSWVFEQAHANGVTTLLNPAPMRADFPLEMLRHTDILAPNQSEFVELVGRLGVAPEPTFGLQELAALSHGELHRLCRQLGVPTVIITLGKDGCFVDQEKEYAHVNACGGIEVVDTTGAGDAFIGGLSAHLVEKSEGALAAARFASAVAALCVTKKGATPAMPTRDQVETFLADVGAG